MIVGTCQPEDACQPTNIDDDCFDYLKISSSVPLIKGLCSSDSISNRFLDFMSISFALLFRKKRYVEKT